ncbi:helix-turn-helix domain-containing protein [Saccharopolyspora erythraea]|uniref:helix-turn-helix domain-containing protein n=1 Tax=Saccharopolyspora erythraea TaxID=1836 RepID=UPI001BA5C1ED|nr:helix-turn-helix domain-containing protein [Saccharopolyspora erythraea]QUH05021.1 helix-turn-helix domain-containing protein [Saccharopolyspora erythraea]
MPTIARWTGFEAKLLRDALRLTVNDFAALLGVSTRTINKWESKRAEITPLPEMQSALDTALTRAADDVRERFDQLKQAAYGAGEPRTVQAYRPAVTAGSAGSSQTMVGNIVEFIGSDMATRREFLELSLLTGTALVVPVRHWAAASPVVPVKPGQVGPDEIDSLEQAVDLFRRWDASGQGGLHRKAVLGQLNAVVETLEHSHPAAAQRRLFEVVGQLAQLAGWMTWDAGFPVGAQRYFLYALDACKHAGALDLGAKVVGDMAQLSKALGQYEDSLAMVRTALATLPRNANPLVRSELHGHEACAYARFGRDEATNTRRSAEASLEAFDQATADAHQPWNQYMDRAEVESLASAAYTQLALRDTRSERVTTYSQHAEVHALNAAAHRQQHRLRSRLFDDLRMSKVRLAQQEPEESAVLAQRALHQAEAISSSHALNRLLDHSRNLTDRYGDVVTVVDFHANLTEYVHKVAPGRKNDLA